MPSAELRSRLEGTVVHGLAGLPDGLLRPLLGPPSRVDGQELDLDAQLLIKLAAIAGLPETHELGVRDARAGFRHSARSLGGAQVAVDRVEDITVAGAAGPLDARLYVPPGEDERRELLVYFHGGGFVVCDLDTHDNLCRLLARESGVRVLSVDYRLAPEHPFPAPFEDAIAAFQDAASRADELAGPGARVAVGGDSAGGNLAVGVCLAALAHGERVPAFQLLFYPWLDLSRKRPSHAHFATGYLLTEANLDWYAENYLTDPSQALDVRCSPLLAERLHGLPPAYLASAGFDPLRDDGKDYVGRLREAGVAVALRPYPGSIHGFANLLGVGRLGRDPVLEAAGALRVSLAAG